MRSNSVTRQVSFNKSKVGGNCQNSKIQMRHFGWFSNTVHQLGNYRKENWCSSSLNEHFLFFGHEPVALYSGQTKCSSTPAIIFPFENHPRSLFSLILPPQTINFSNCTCFSTEFRQNFDFNCQNAWRHLPKLKVWSDL